MVDFDKILDEVSKKFKPKRRTKEQQTKAMIGKFQRIYGKLRAGQRIFYSTHDVEMAKWGFKQVCKEEVVFVPTEHERIYIIKFKE